MKISLQKFESGIDERIVNRGIEIDGEEYFIHLYLRKEMLSKLRKKFLFKEDIV